MHACELTSVLDLHVCKDLQRVLKGDAFQVLRSNAVVHLLGVVHKLLRELLDLLGCQVPPQPVLCANRHRTAKHHFTWNNVGCHMTGNYEIDIYF